MKPRKEEFYHYEELELCHFVEMAKKFPAHFHDHYLIGCLLSGERSTICAASRFLLKPFDLFLANPGIPHGCDCGDGAPAQWLCVHIPAKTMGALWQGATGQTGLPMASINVIPGKPLCMMLLAMLQGARAGCLENIVRELSALVSALAANGALILPPWPGDANNALMPDMALLNNGLRQNPANAMSLSDMASLAKMDKFSFLRLFRKRHNITPWAWLENLRVNMAMEMLRQGAPLVSAALDSGFWDQSHFNRRFKSYTGFTPGLYRRACSHAP